MSTKELDDFGAKILAGFGARSAPLLPSNDLLNDKNPLDARRFEKNAVGGH